MGVEQMGIVRDLKRAPHAIREKEARRDSADRDTDSDAEFLPDSKSYDSALLNTQRRGGTFCCAA
jgi:hypothetical protein